MHRLFRRTILALTGLSALAVALAAPPLPFKGRFDFTEIDAQSVTPTSLLVLGSLDGNETHLGRFTGEVMYIVDLTTWTFEGMLTKRAANGDLLYQTVDGYLTGTGSKGEFTITGGTGRFQGATGGGTFEGVWTDADMTTAHITFDGQLSLAHGK